jgi:molybdenum cofactor guanylyltransferase
MGTCVVALPAYILAGGQSRRFGSDKARAALRGAPLILHVAGVLRAVGEDVTAVAEVAEKYVDFGLRTIGDLHPGAGPLAGLETALADRLDRLGAGWVVVASCDLAALRAEWVEVIAGRLPAADSTIDFRAVAYRSEVWQPFPAGYHTELLPVVREFLDGGKASFQRLLSDGRARATAVALPCDWPAVPQVNTREDLRQIEG